ncbi:hypothetical protein [uncultured Parabacteroides sp.]|uniref:hypothetical protein n=1 Tax=uncultured Parabacteroides sp. TaxID=512312 RepID=UPI0026EE2269|nr:hypothetical protein [uncultured Parabacteroides sp.]
MEIISFDVPDASDCPFRIRPQPPASTKHAFRLLRGAQPNNTIPSERTERSLSSSPAHFERQNVSATKTASCRQRAATVLSHRSEFPPSIVPRFRNGKKKYLFSGPAGAPPASPILKGCPPKQ